MHTFFGIENSFYRALKISYILLFYCLVLHNHSNGYGSNFHGKNTMDLGNQEMACVYNLYSEFGYFGSQVDNSTSEPYVRKKVLPRCNEGLWWSFSEKRELAHENII